ncbi:MAG: UbiA family prenyltransferase [Nitrososphaeraceae archaeon]|nr:UbiA family prenyltransferase [Nitrososphaeraceae archaeon]
MSNFNTILNYLTLIRFPNIFTTIPNIILGYFLFTDIQDTDYLDLSILLIVSILLYIGGVVLNDYFDITKDKKERPSRPLPSNIIPKRNALYISISCFLSSLFLSLYTSLTGLLITITMLILIFIYNSYSKERISGPPNMGAIRSLNILLGSSTSFSFSMFDLQLIDSKIPIIIISEFSYVCLITWLSRNETEDKSFNKKFLLTFSTIYLMIVFMIFLIFIDIFNVNSVLNLTIFATIIIYSHYLSIKRNFSIQKLISILIVLMVAFDSIFISSSIGILYGLMILLLIPLIFFLSKKMYMT